MRKTNKRKKTEINLGCTWETKYLVSQYRILRALERGARKFAPNFEEPTRKEIAGDYKLAKDMFISFAYSAYLNNSLSSLDYIHSNSLGIQAALFRILRDNDLLEDAVAELVCLELNESKEKIKKYGAHLRFYLNHPEVMKHYKFNAT